LFYGGAEFFAGHALQAEGFDRQNRIGVLVFGIALAGTRLDRPRVRPELVEMIS